MDEVWVVEQGTFADEHVVGVYATLGAAQEAHPGDWKPIDEIDLAPSERDRPPWTNGLDYEDKKTITRWRVDPDATQAAVRLLRGGHTGPARRLVGDDFVNGWLHARAAQDDLGRLDP